MYVYVSYICMYIYSVTLMAAGGWHVCGSWVYAVYIHTFIHMLRYISPYTRISPPKETYYPPKETYSVHVRPCVSVRLYVLIDSCIHARMRMYIDVLIHVLTHSSKHRAGIRTLIYLSICKTICLYVCKTIRTYVCMYIHTHPHPHPHPHPHTYVYTHTYTCTRTHTYTYTYIFYTYVSHIYRGGGCRCTHGDQMQGE